MGMIVSMLVRTIEPVLPLLTLVAATVRLRKLLQLLRLRSVEQRWRVDEIALQNGCGAVHDAGAERRVFTECSRDGFEAGAAMLDRHCLDQRHQVRKLFIGER